MVKVLIDMIDNYASGYKTYALMFLGFLMMACQMMGYHVFTTEAWGMLGIGAAATWKMGVDRK
jgi:hypothetical protein|tara:strand:- start:150 stop:338 length:189 start_codon:yes stop_codon:yes gene_type:complete